MPSPIFGDAGNVQVRELGSQAAELSGILEGVQAEIRRHIVGQDRAIHSILTSLVAGGHVLLEGVPGLAKTGMARALAGAIDVDFARIQFTPDLLPADILGTRVYDAASGSFRTERGPIFHRIILADEINRAPPKVQSALLEAMQEGQASIHGETIPLPGPFLVIATQNPLEDEGTFRLPEAQVDRFAVKIMVGYPSREEEVAIIEMDGGSKEARPVVDGADIQKVQALSRQVYADGVISRYVADIAAATRDPAGSGLDLDGAIQHGASPRASVWLMRTARAHALLDGRGFVMPEDVKAVAHDVLRHRIMLTFEAEADGLRPEGVIDAVLARVPPP
ncbi:MoxR-like ATPases [Cenarchaeum symbiosum A]|uniref:MoxR-like ATPases n=1 Tax=Cenarchaeum symbiosum (strain A) TaxID=414004 RepID=A0RTM7_CENSY|nr:MoxR-like ATPases [Cenarchaeum symbiosum A]